jgi:hypothetical protein
MQIKNNCGMFTEIQPEEMGASDKFQSKQNKKNTAYDKMNTNKT